MLNPDYHGPPEVYEFVRNFVGRNELMCYPGGVLSLSGRRTIWPGGHLQAIYKPQHFRV